MEMISFTAGVSSLDNIFIGGWAGPIVGLDAVGKRKIPSPCRE
jgi:hypothetical protein